jgi:hypothetical protein
MRLRLWLLDHLPDGLLAHPAEWFIAFLCAMSGISTLLGLTSPEAVERVLPTPVYALWGICLVAGSAAYACGLSSIRFTATGTYVVTRVSCYRLGLRLLATASLVFAASILIVSGWDGSVLALLLFAAMCAIRLLVLGGRRS